VARFAVLTAERIAELTRRGTGSDGVDLTEYKEWVRNAATEGWGQIELEATDSVRAIKRRTTIAGKELGKIVKWNRRSTAESLIFQIFDRETPPAKRKRGSRKKSD
jgi:hypothetical protein